MKYIRTKDGIFEITEQDVENHCLVIKVNENRHDLIHKSLVINQADTIEELIQLNDIVFYWQQSDDKEHCALMTYNVEIETMKHSTITKILIPIGNDYKCVAKAEPSFELIKGRRYLVKKGELELL